MRSSIITAALALAGSSLAAPAPRPGFQQDIDELKGTINMVVLNIVQPNITQLKTTYATGRKQVDALVAQLVGQEPCLRPVPRPLIRSLEGAVLPFRRAQESLSRLSSDLLVPNNSVAAGDFRENVCYAQSRYVEPELFVNGWNGTEYYGPWTA